MKYMVVFGRDEYMYYGHKHVLLYGHIEGFANTIEEAKALRKTSGDLVFDAVTKEIVEDERWLWESETASLFDIHPNNYPARAIRNKCRLADDFWATNREVVPQGVVLHLPKVTGMVNYRPQR